MTLDQISKRTIVARQRYGQYRAHVERCEQVIQHAHDLGWKVTRMLHDERSIRGAESLFGVVIRSDFPERTPLSKLIYSI